MKVKCYGVAKKFLDGYSYDQVLRDNRLTAPQIADDVMTQLEK